MPEIYELAYRINGQPERSILRRGTLMEMQAAVSDALHYDLDFLSLVKTGNGMQINVTEGAHETTTEGVMKLLEPVHYPFHPLIEVKQAPINTANRKCRNCGESIRSIGDENTRFWVHQETGWQGCTFGSVATAIPVGE